MRFTGDINEVALTPLSTGDLDNGVYLSYFDGNPEIKKKNLEIFIKNKAHNPIDDLVSDVIFSGGDISDDILRRCTIMLTFFDAIRDITGTEAVVKNPKALYFALVVNWNASKGNGQNKIKSVSAMTMAEEVTAQLDYREYIVNGGGDNTKFDGDYKSIRVVNKDFSSEIELMLPIVRGILGTFRFCTDGIAGRMRFSNDPDSTEYMIPARLWMDMIAEAMGRRLTTRFSSFENGRLHKLIKLEARTIEDLLSINNFSVKFSFINAYEIHIDDDMGGELELVNTSEPPELPKEGGEENPTWQWYDNANKKALKYSRGIYYVTMSGSAIKIWVE